MITNIKKFIFILPFLILFSCGGAKEAADVLSGGKKKTTDEFLVKKRAPLTLPPQYDTIPEPRSLEETTKNKNKKINKILRITEKDKLKKSGATSVEQSIINQIKK